MIACRTSLLATFAIACSVGSASATGGPTAHWRFDEGTGTTTADSSDNDITGNFMTPNPAWTTDTPPVSFTNPYALKFENTGDGVSVAWPVGQNFSGTEERSFSFWYKPTANGETASGNYDRIISWSSDAFEIAGTLGNVAVHRMAFYDGSWRDTGFDLTVNTWYNITFTYDGTNVKLYVSGVEKFSGTSGGRDISGTMYIGVRHTGDEGINGIIDDVRIYDYALTEDQIDNLVAGSDDPDSAPAPTLSGALLPADNGTGVTLSSNLVMTFDTNVQTGTGNIVIKKTSDSSVFETIPATNARVTGSGGTSITINPTGTFAEGTQYHVLVDAFSFKSGAGVHYEGLSGTGSWNFTTADTTDPVIMNVTATVSSSTGATITWTTNEIASTNVSYGLASSRGTNTSETDTSPRVTSHSKALTGLRACTTYHYAAVSTDGFSNTATSTGSTFTTAGCTGDAAVLTSTGTNVIYNANGSTGSILLSGTGDSISLSIPSGYIASNPTCPTGAQFQLKAMEASPVREELGAPSGRGTIVSAHDFSAYCPDFTPVTSFDESLTITFNYDSDDIANLVESSLGVYRYGSGSTAWEELTCSQDASANTLTCSTTEFSSFGLFGTSVSSSSGNSGAVASGGGGGGGCRGGGCRSILLKNPLAYRQTTVPPVHAAATAGPPAHLCSMETVPSANEYLRMTVDNRSVIFRDVHVVEWFACSVHGAIERGIFSGYLDSRGNPTGFYGPGDPITLGQLAKVAMQLAKREVTGRTLGDNWAASYMREAEAMQLSAFTRKMNADTRATRGAVLQTILEALGIPMEDGELPYIDVSAGSMYAKAIATSTALGIVSGDDARETFRPNAPINRAEVAKMVVRALVVVGH